MNNIKYLFRNVKKRHEPLSSSYLVLLLYGLTIKTIFETIVGLLFNVQVMITTPACFAVTVPYSLTVAISLLLGVKLYLSLD